jgi:hypothetical protein
VGLVTVKVERRLSVNEVQRKIEKFEKQFNMKFEEFERKFLDGGFKEDLSAEYLEWSELVHAYQAYVEAGEMEYLEDQFVDLSPKQLGALLTCERIRLLENIDRIGAESIYDLSRAIHRNVKNVYTDLKILENLNFVTLEKEKKGKRLIPKLQVEKITIEIR